jgi:hypothetical protein
MGSRGSHNEMDDDTGYHGPERRHDSAPHEVSPVRLTRKYAEAIDGINLAGRDVGDRVPLPPRDAELLIAEGWAEPTPREERRHSTHYSVRAQAADRPRRPRRRR